GSELLEGPALMDEPATAILSEFRVPRVEGPSSESPTRAQIHTTDQTAILPAGAEAQTQKALGEVTERQRLSADKAAEPHRKRNKLLAILGISALLLAGGFLGYRYFARAYSKQIESIAVMPFRNESGNSDVEYLS